MTFFSFNALNNSVTINLDSYLPRILYKNTIAKNGAKKYFIMPFSQHNPNCEPSYFPPENGARLKSTYTTMIHIPGMNLEMQYDHILPGL